MCHSKIATPVPCEKSSTQAGPANAKVSQPRRWWAETTRHITNLRMSVSKQKLPVHTLAKGDDNAPNIVANNNNNTIPNSKSTTTTDKQLKHEDHVQKFVNRLLVKGGKVDEVAARSRRNPHTIPVHPKLRLSRLDKCEAKVPVPVAVTLVTFPPARYW